MSPRASQPTKKKIIMWSSDRQKHKELCDWLSSAGYEVAVYPDVHDIVAVCAAELPDLVILGAEDSSILDRLDEDKRSRRLPVLLLTESDDAPAGVAASRAYLTDWLKQDVCEEDLILKVRAILRVAHAESIASEPAERDSLTKLYNRRYFDERLEREIERARRYGRKLTCVMMDVDDFEGLIETYGHRTGDRVLAVLSDLLLSRTRCSDIIARYGGQEFAMLLPETPDNDARTMSERIRKALAARSFKYGTEEFKTTLSCGVATYPDHARDAETLVRMANSAIFEAKGMGGNTTFVAFSDAAPAEESCVKAGPTILIVEDNDYSRSVASLVLRASGYEVLEAGDGDTALSIVKELHPDLILIDIQLSDANGMIATRELIKMEENKNVPIVALTARDMPVDLDELVREGCRGYIVKPIDTNNLAVQIRSYLES